jgi:hypothetical protein
MGPTSSRITPSSRVCHAPVLTLLDGRLELGYQRIAVQITILHSNPLSWNWSIDGPSKFQSCCPCLSRLNPSSVLMAPIFDGHTSQRHSCHDSFADRRIGCGCGSSEAVRLEEGRTDTRGKPAMVLISGTPMPREANHLYVWRFLTLLIRLAIRN